MLENGQRAPPGRRGGQAPPTLRWEPLTVLGNMVGPVKRAFPSPWVLQPRCGAAGRKASGTAGPALAPAGSQLLGRHCTSWVCPSHSSHLLDTPAPSPGLHPPPSLTEFSTLRPKFADGTGVIPASSPRFRQCPPHTCPPGRKPLGAARSQRKYLGPASSSRCCRFALRLRDLVRDQAPFSTCYVTLRTRNCLSLRGRPEFLPCPQRLDR